MANRLTVPERCTVIDASIFIASMVATVWPSSTLSPSATDSVTTPANGAARCAGLARSAFSVAFTSLSIDSSRTVTGRRCPFRVVSTLR